MNRLTFLNGLILLLILAPGSGWAASIVQVMTVRQAAHDTNYAPYDQFNPTLGTLTGVTLDFSHGVATTNQYVFTNSSPIPVTAVTAIHSFLTCGSDLIDLTQSFSDTLAPFQQVSHKVTMTFSCMTVYTSDLGPWIGTHTLNPDTYLGGLFGFTTCDMPGVSVFHDESVSATFTETITYTYLSPSDLASVPEPMSLVSLGLGLAWVLWIQGRKLFSA